jgi:fucose permease
MTNSASTNRFRIIAALALIYIVFAILLNSVGTVILQSIASFGIDKPAASALERYKDLTIAVASFVVASFLPLLGYRRSMMLALVIVGVACVLMPLYPNFLTTRLLFASVGFAFALTKVSVYSSIGLVTTDKAAHGRLTNTIEGLFMVGVLGGNWLFSLYVDPANPGDPAWLNVYWPLAGLCAFTLLLLATTRLDESAAHVAGHNRSTADALREMARLLAQPLVYVFLISVFLYPMIEQSFGTWLPTFNNEVLKLPNAMSIQFASVLAGMIGLGRFAAVLALRKVRWYTLLNACVIGMAVLVVVALPLARGVVARPDVDWFHAPLAAYLIPLLGLLMGPIYPVINSVSLSSLPKPMHAAMTGLIVVVSALGGTAGSYVTARVFAGFDGIYAFYFSLVPISLMLVSLFFFKRKVDGAPATVAEQVP